MFKRKELIVLGILASTITIGAKMPTVAEAQGLTSVRSGIEAYYDENGGTPYSTAMDSLENEKAAQEAYTLIANNYSKINGRYSTINGEIRIPFSETIKQADAKVKKMKPSSYKTYLQLHVSLQKRIESNYKKMLQFNEKQRRNQTIKWDEFENTGKELVKIIEDFNALENSYQGNDDSKFAFAKEKLNNLTGILSSMGKYASKDNKSTELVEGEEISYIPDYNGKGNSYLPTSNNQIKKLVREKLSTSGELKLRLSGEYIKGSYMLTQYGFSDVDGNLLTDTVSNAIREAYKNAIITKISYNYMTNEYGQIEAIEINLSSNAYKEKSGESDKKAAEEAARLKAEEEKRAAEEEAARLKAEEEKRASEEEAARLKAEEEKRAAEEEAARLKAEEEKKAEEETAKPKEEENNSEEINILSDDAYRKEARDIYRLISSNYSNLNGRYSTLRGEIRVPLTEVIKQADGAVNKLNSSSYKTYLEEHIALQKRIEENYKKILQFNEKKRDNQAIKWDEFESTVRDLSKILSDFKALEDKYKGNNEFKFEFAEERLNNLSNILSSMEGYAAKDNKAKELVEGEEISYVPSYNGKGNSYLPISNNQIKKLVRKKISSSGEMKLKISGDFIKENFVRTSSGLADINGNLLTDIVMKAIKGTYKDGIVKQTSYSYMMDAYGRIESIEVTLTSRVTEAQQKEIDKKIIEIINSKEYKEKQNIKDKVQYIHDWLVQNMEYSFGVNSAGEEASSSNTSTGLNSAGADVHSPYSVLKNGKGVCQAYATFFVRAIELMKEVGKEDISVKYITGTAGSRRSYGSHAWTSVTVDNVEYFIDPTFDDPTYVTPNNGDYTSYRKRIIRDYFWKTAEEFARIDRERGTFHIGEN
ncbi:transglutaminase domain-containing protein [Clostridium cadaveris]|uniref:transglutaminase domain-containing protein n=1 Tax=Clostridium cadaveris TaxID=1529 RepID=UPI0025A41628|nr:transglutaminase domain-containing protein [Clostridium cadaveris]MDM8311784.1 transglutaminase domain-containing protein [Clostridium cadaveris]